MARSTISTLVFIAALAAAGVTGVSLAAGAGVGEASAGSGGPPAAAPSVHPRAPSHPAADDPADLDAAHDQAVSLINERRYDDALAFLAKAEGKFGQRPDLVASVGDAYWKLGQPQRAEAYYRQALAAAPGHRAAAESWGELKVEQGDLAGARRLLAELDRQCAFGCAEAETLRTWIVRGAKSGA